MEDNEKYAGLMSAVRDVMMKNTNLYQQDFERRYGGIQQHATPAEVEAVTQNNEVEVPDPIIEPENIDPESVIPGSSGVEVDGQEE